MSLPRIGPACGLLLALASSGCGTSLTVRHLDAGHKVAEVSVDGTQRGTLTFGEELEIPLEPGVHTVRVIAPGGKSSPWHPGDESVELVLEEDAVMTLQPHGPDR